MADWIGSARSNYFKVKDIERYKAFCDIWDVKPFTEDGSVGFLCEGGLPSFREDDDGKKYEFDDFLNELSGLLEESEVAIMMEIGAEKLRYVTGVAIAINSKGERREVQLYDIYGHAKKLGANVTAVEY